MHVPGPVSHWPIVGVARRAPMLRLHARVHSNMRDRETERKREREREREREKRRPKLSECADTCGKASRGLTAIQSQSSAHSASVNTRNKY